MPKTLRKKTEHSRSKRVDVDVMAAPEIPENRYELKILQAIRRIMRGIDTYSRSLIAAHELTTPQLICLLNIIENDNRTTPTRIAREIYLSPSTVIGILDRLEQKDLIRRTRDKSDRRVVNISATAKGRGVAEKAPSPLQDSLAASLSGLPQKEQATISRSLERIIELMEIEHLDASPILESGHSINKTGQKSK